MVETVDNLPCFKDLIAVLIECFLIISLGYFSASFKLISTQAKDLNSYLTTFALPMIIFLNIAQMEFQTINLSFLICMLSAKLLVFATVTLLTLLISYPTNFGFAGSLSILTTQSNDFALGYPLIKSLYGESRQEMLSYLSLMAPIQLLILNPLGIVMLEYNKARKKKVKKKCKHCKKTESARFNPDTTDSRGAPSNLQTNPSTSIKKNSSITSPIYNTKSSSTNPEIRVDLRQRPNPSSINRQQVEPVYSPIALSIEDKPSCASQEVKSKHLKHHIHNRHVKPRPLIKSGCYDDAGGLVESESEESINALGEFNNENKLVNPSSTSQTQAKFILGAMERISSPNFNQQLNVQTIPSDSSISATSGTVVVTDQERPSCTCSILHKRHSTIDLSFLKSLTLNPLIIASVVALTVNLTYGPELPKFVTKVSHTIAASFASPALFVVGVSMYGKFDLLRKNPNDLLLSSVLVLTKVLLLPNLMRTLALLILPHYSASDEVHYLVDFSYLYGLLPTAPTACIIANQYGQLPNVVSISMLLSTFLSAPLLLASSVIINPSTVIEPTIVQSIITQTMKVSCIVSLVLASTTLYAFWRSRSGTSSSNFVRLSQLTSGILRKMQEPTHIFLILLVFSQALVGFGGSMWYFVDNSSPILQIFCGVQYIITSFGLMMARFVILSLIITLAAKRLGDRGLATKSSAIFVRLFCFVGFITFIWLAFDTQSLEHTATEASLPNQRSTLFVRLVYNIIFLIITVPIFSIMVKSINKAKFQQDVKSEVTNIQVGDSLLKTSFLTSSTSLSSDASSAITSNTNLDSSTTSGILVNQDLNNNRLNHLQNDSPLSIVLDASNLDFQSNRKQINHAESRTTLDTTTRIDQSNTSNPLILPNVHELDDSSMNDQNNAPSYINEHVIQTLEFHKYSMLIVFMMLDSLHNMTTIAQKLLNDHPFGTFRQVEVTNAAMEFGQGLLTFLIYRMNGLLS